MILSHVHLAPGIMLPLAGELGGGGGGKIFEVVGEPHLAVKLHVDPRPAPDLTTHLRTPAAAWLDARGTPRLAWPMLAARDQDGRQVGFLMLRLNGWLVVDDLKGAIDRRASGVALDWGQLLTVAARLAQLIVDVHAARIVVADLSALNVMVSPDCDVALVDCDDMLLRTDHAPDARRPLLAASYKAPELIRSTKVAPSEQTDAWALAILVCQLLLDGSHPFEGSTRRLSSAEVGIEDNVVHGRTRFRQRRFHEAERKFDEMPVSLEVLPPRVLELATRCFVEDHRKPATRPRPADWVQALNDVSLAYCDRRPAHVYSDHLNACPWCAHDRELFGQPSPV